MNKTLIKAWVNDICVQYRSKSNPDQSWCDYPVLIYYHIHTIPNIFDSETIFEWRIKPFFRVGLFQQNKKYYYFKIANSLEDMTAMEHDPLFQQWVKDITYY